MRYIQYSKFRYRKDNIFIKNRGAIIDIFLIFYTQSSHYSPIMANQKVSIIVMQVHTVSFAIAKQGTVGA